jgi:hypothetical protein
MGIVNITAYALFSCVKCLASISRSVVSVIVELTFFTVFQKFVQCV